MVPGTRHVSEHSATARSARRASSVSVSQRSTQLRVLQSETGAVRRSRARGTGLKQCGTRKQSSFSLTGPQQHGECSKSSRFLKNLGNLLNLHYPFPAATDKKVDRERAENVLELELLVQGVIPRPAHGTSHVQRHEFLAEYPTAPEYIDEILGLPYRGLERREIELYRSKGQSCLAYRHIKARIFFGLACAVEQNFRASSGKVRSCHPFANEKSVIRYIQLGSNIAQMVCPGKDTNVTSDIYKQFERWGWINKQDLGMMRSDSPWYVRQAVNAMLPQLDRMILLGRYSRWEDEQINIPTAQQLPNRMPSTNKMVIRNHDQVGSVPYHAQMGENLCSCQKQLEGHPTITKLSGGIPVPALTIPRSPSEDGAHNLMNLYQDGSESSISSAGWDLKPPSLTASSEEVSSESAKRARRRASISQLLN